MLRRKLSYGHADVLIELFAQQRGVGLFVGWGVNFPLYLRICHPLPPKIESEIHGDPVQPRVKRRGHTEPPDGAIGLGKHLLCQFQGVLPIPYHPIEKGVNLPLIGSHEILKGIFLPPLYPLYQIPFFQSSSVYLDAKLCAVFTLFSPSSSLFRHRMV